MDNIKKYVIDNLLNEKYDSSRYVAYVDNDILVSFNKSDIIEFITFCLDYLKIGTDVPKLQIKLTATPEKGVNSFAYYIPKQYYVYVNCKNRHKLDVFRSLAHELVHYNQDLNGDLEDVEQVRSDNDGVPIENEANSMAGVIMREYGRQKPEFFG